MKNSCCHCFKLLSSKSRFRIFEFLKGCRTKKVNVNDLVKLSSLRHPTVSFHLKKLKDNGFLKKYKKGREVYCQVCQKCV